MNAIEFVARRVVGWPVAVLGAVLSAIAHELLLVSAWLLDRDDILEELDRGV